MVGPDNDVFNSRDSTSAILPGPAPDKGIDSLGNFYLIPIVIQDRSFNADGSLFHSDNWAFLEGLDPSQLEIPFIPDLACYYQSSEIAPVW